MELKDSYDVVVIGGGIGGLTCGALLAMNRVSVLVAEQGSKPGGCCTSFEHKGYIFDNGLSALLGCEFDGAIYETLVELGLISNIEFIKMEPAIRVIGNDYDVRISSAESLEDRLVELFPMEAPAIRKFIAECKVMAAEMERLSKTSLDLVNILQKIFFYITFLLKYGRMRKYGGKSWQEVITSLFEDVKLRAILLSATPLDPRTMAPLPMMLLGTGEGFYYPKGGAQALADLLADGVSKYDGELALNTMVNKILIEDKKAAGVVLSDGRQVRSRYVISNVDARQTFLNLVGEERLTTKFRKEIMESQLSDSPFLVSLGVSLNLKVMGFDEAFIVYNPCDDIDELFGTDPEKHQMSILTNSIKEPSQVPNSNTCVQLLAMFPYDAVENWEAEQDAIADKLIASADNVIPRLSEHIICKRITTPLTMEQNTLNSQGAMGWLPTPRSKVRSQKTPIKNLYQAGQWTYPGAGVPTVITSGGNAAQLALKGKLSSNRRTI